MLRGLRASLAFMTRLPVGGGFAPDDWRWASAHFPFAGLVVGAILAGTWYLFQRAGGLVQAILCVAVSLLVTGALHEDGLADTADALGGAREPARVLAILKDPRVGSFGAAALAVALLLRVALIARLGSLAPAALVATQCAARTAPVWLMRALPYVTGDDAKSRPVAGAAWPQTAIATIWPVLAIAALVASGRLTSTHAAGLALSTAAAALLCGWRFKRRLGGVTGDFLGAVEQVAECAQLLTLALIQGRS